MKTPRGTRVASVLDGDVDTRRGLWRTTLVYWVWAALFFSLWSLATPLWGAPDSVAHDLRAYGAAHGNLSPDPPTGERVLGTTGVDHIPEGLVQSANTASCYAFQPLVSAECITPIGDSKTLVDFDNPAGRYIPTYYAVTGLPSLVVPLTLSMGAERAAALLISSFFLAMALAAARTMRRPSLAMIGVVIGCSPQVLYLGGVVNPNSLEITAMAAAGANSLAALMRPDSPITDTLLRRALLAGTALCVTRMISPVWLAIWLGVLLVAFGWVVARRLLERRMLPWTALPIVACVINLVWTLSPAGAMSGTPAPVADVGLSEAWSLAANRIDVGLSEVVGFFGWLDTTLSPRDYVFYTSAAIFLIGMFATYVDKRRFASIVTLVAAAYFVPIAIQAAQWNSVGPVWQGRYTIPLLLLIPVMTAFVAAESDALSLKRIAVPTVAVTGLLAYVHIRAYFAQLRRNVSGVEGGAFDGGWEPPLTSEVQFALFVLLVLLTWLALSRWLLRASAREGALHASAREDVLQHA